jgi:hypothetical protein
MFEHRLRYVGKRDWRYIREAVVADAARLPATPGIAPEYTIAETPGFRAISGKAMKDGPEVREPMLAHFRSAMLHEAIFLLHKAGNVLVASHDQAAGGLPTWSVATGYQAALFAAEALIRVLGVAAGLNVDNRYYLVDVWPEGDAKMSKKAFQAYRIGSEMIVVRHSQLNHFDGWDLLLRVLRLLVNDPFPSALRVAITSIDKLDFAKQRNDLHYETGWIFDDLHEYVVPSDFFRPTDAHSLAARVVRGRLDFGIALGTVLFAMANCLVRDLASLSPLIQAEHALIAKASTAPRMKLRANYEACGVGALA